MLTTMYFSEQTKSYAKNMLFFVGKAVPNKQQMTQKFGTLFSITGGLKVAMEHNFMELGANIASAGGFLITAPQLNKISNTLMLTSSVLNAVETIKNTSYNNSRSQVALLHSSLTVGALLLNAGFLLSDMFYGCDMNPDCNPSADTFMMKCAAGVNFIAMGANYYLEKTGNFRRR